MNTKIIFHSPHSQAFKNRILLTPQHNKESTLNKTLGPNVQESFKDRSPAKELSQKYFQSVKQPALVTNIKNLRKESKEGIENVDTMEIKYERQLAKVKKYEAQINSLINSHRIYEQEAEAKCRGLQKQRNEWKQISMKLKMQIESRVSNAQALTKLQVIKPNQRDLTQQENSSLNANRTSEDQLNRLRVMNAQMISQISKLRSQSTNMKYYITRLQGHIKSIQQRNKASSPASHNRSSSKSPARMSYKNVSSPNRSHSSHHQHHHQKDTNLNIHDQGKQLDKLRKQVERLHKWCGKLEKLNKDKNEETMKEKIKILNQKYIKL